MPTTKTLLLLAIVANAATPGTINWLAEFYVLLGATYQNLLVAFIIASTVLLTAAYSFWMYSYVSSNSDVGNNSPVIADATQIEITSLLYLLIPNIIVGVYPSFIENYIITNAISLTY